MANQPQAGKDHPLISGYRRWRRKLWPQEARERVRLAREGQKPLAVIVGCADSRADPGAIFDAAPGELFVLRNVAALVPPPEADGFHHGTSAGLEFAVTSLQVPHLLILGHTGCGGVAAALAGVDEAGGSAFIGPWVRLLAEARSRVRARRDLDEAGRQRALEEEAVRLSLARARRFPFIAEAEKAGRLRLDGALFDIATGGLLWLDQERDVFRRIPAQADDPHE